MTAQILDGRALAAKLKAEVQTSALAFASAHGRSPALHLVLVGDDPGSATYVRHKEKAALELGLVARVHRLPVEVTRSALRRLLDDLCADDLVDGIVLQLPLPVHLPTAELLDGVVASKDVDGLHPYNAGLLSLGRARWLPPTPSGVMRLLAETGMDLAGKHALVIGRSNIVGKPMAELLTARDATVTLAHSRTRQLAELARTADVIVAATGVPGLVHGDWINPGAVVIDVGQSTNREGKLVGDVAFEEARERASFITKVPGGVGPMTVACLLENTVLAARARSARVDVGVDSDPSA